MKYTAQAEYEALVAARQPFLDRAISCAKLTLPYLIPPMEFNGTSVLPDPNQNLGTRGVNNIVSKLLLTLFPPNSPFFKHTITDFDIAKLANRDDMKTEFEQAFAAIERNITQEVEARALRVGVHEALKHLVVGGNVLVNIPRSKKKRAGARVFSLHKYVVARDGEGHVRKIIIKELVHPDVLVDRGLSKPTVSGKQEDNSNTKTSPEKNVAVYTVIRLMGDKWKIHQEAWDQIIPGSAATEPKDSPSWLALRLYRVDGEDYGRGYTEEQYGDLAAYDTLCGMLTAAFGAFSKVLFMVDPTGSTKKDTVANSRNGDVINGREGDVSILQSDGKVSDLAAIAQYAEKLANDLKFAFLMNSAIQRNGERVTAEEIRTMAQELETAIGGVYILLSQELQLAVVNIIKAQMEAEGRLPELPSDAVTISIVTGIEALGRGNDLAKLAGFMSDLAQMANVPDDVKARVDMGELVKRVAIGRQIDPINLIKTDEQIQQDAQDQTQAEMAMQVAPQAVQAGARLAEQGMKQANG